MRETVLLFNIKDKKRAQELQMICMSLRIRDKKRRVFSDGWCTCRNERSVRDRQDL